MKKTTKVLLALFTVSVVGFIFSFIVNSDIDKVNQYFKQEVNAHRVLEASYMNDSDKTFTISINNNALNSITIKNSKANNLSHLNINSISSNVLITPSEDENILIEYVYIGEAKKDMVLETKIIDNTLFINEEVYRAVNFSMFFDSTIKVHIPHEIITNLNIKSSSGNINAHEINIDTIVLNTTSGDIENSISSTNSMIKTSSGDVNIDGSSDLVKIETTSGDIRGIINESNSIDIRVSSGDISLDTKSTNAIVKSTSGDIRMSLSGGSYSFEASSGDITLLTDEDTKITGKTSSGDIYIFGKHYEDEVFIGNENILNSIVFKTTSGDIKVNKK